MTIIFHYFFCSSKFTSEVISNGWEEYSVDLQMIEILSERGSAVGEPLHDGVAQGEGLVDEK